jgi:Ca2+-binding EF-hand superfamily protein
VSTGISALQKEKLIYMFGLLDVDGNGVLEYDDFRMVVDVMCDERGWSSGHRRRLGLKRANKRLWDMMANHLDLDGDGEITMAEWLTFHFTAFCLDPDLKGTDRGLSQALNATARFFCEMLDSDGDGKVSEVDYVLFSEAYQIPKDEASQSFRRFDTNQDGILQLHEVETLVKEFYISEDEEALGNVFFGVF